MKQCISILLSIFLLASSSGIAYAQHYCGEYQVMAKVTMGEAHLSCGMIMQDDSCDNTTVEEPDCCDNEYTTVSTDENFTKAHFDFNIPFIAAFVSTFILKTSVVENRSNTKFADYNPPPLIKDISVLYETFLI